MRREVCDELALGAHVLAELIAGTILLVQPLLFAPSPDGVNHEEALRGIGNGAFCIGVVGACVLREKREKRPQWAFAAMALYHANVVVLQLRHPLLGVPYWLAPLFHGLLLARFVEVALRTKKERLAPRITKTR